MVRLYITVLVIVAAGYVGWVEGRQADAARPYAADFRIAVEDGYSATKDGVQFFSLQRIDSKEVDRAVLSIDADLPLARYLSGAKHQRIRITVEAVEPTEPQRLVR